MPISLYIIDNYFLTRAASKSYFSNDKDFSVLGDFSDFNEFIEKIEKTPSDIVLLDVELSKINCLEAVSFLKKNYPKTKTVVYSAYKDETKILGILSCGACGYVLKGSKSENDLKTVIKMIMKGGFWMDLEIARRAFSKIPKSGFRDNLENKNLKRNLTKREMQVLKLMVAGKTNVQIAREIIVSTNTAKAHVGNILEKLNAKDRTEAAVIAVRANLFD